MKFTKMHGISNDYIYINAIEQTVENRPELAVRLSDRRCGIGGDGIILICPSDKADFMMDMYNADGSRGKMCGNGIRCFAMYVRKKGLCDKDVITIETLSGIKTAVISGDNVRVDMGEPELTAAKIPALCDTEKFVEQPISAGGMDCIATCVSMGNPHCVIFTDIPVEQLDLERIGPHFEHHEMFPEQVNTEFVNLMEDGSLKMRVWERGSGETWACGTGACAVFTAAKITGRVTGDKGTVHLRGGDLEIEWNGEGSLHMTGGAVIVFDGEIEL